MIEIGSRGRSQPAPPHAVYEALINPDRDPSRPWLNLLDDEVRPQIVLAEPFSVVSWTSLWVKRRDAVLRMELTSDGGGGSRLHWSLSVEDPPPDAALTGHLRKRVNELLNRDLRYSFGQ